MASILLQSRGAGLGATFGGDSTVYRSRRGIEKRLFQFTIALRSSSASPASPASCWSTLWRLDVLPRRVAGRVRSVGRAKLGPRLKHGDVVGGRRRGGGIGRRARFRT